MKKNFCLFIVLFSCVLLQAQYKVTFVLKEQTTIKHDSIFVTGTFSNWDSTANRAYLMKPDSKKEKSITINVKAGKLKYKFHRGSWLTVEKQFNGDEIPDRELTIRKDTILIDSATAWRDQFFIDKWLSLSQQLPDTIRLRTLMSLANIYGFTIDDYNSDSAFYYAQQSVQLVQIMKVSNDYKQWFKEGNSGVFINIQETIASLLHSLGNYPRALEIRLENLKLAEKGKDKFLLVDALGNITRDYLSMKDYQSMLHYAKKQDSVLAFLDKTDKRYSGGFFFAKNNAAIANFKLNNFSLAIDYAKQAMNIISSLQNVWGNGWQTTTSSLLLADIYAAMNKYDSALFYYRVVIKNNMKSFQFNFAARSQAGMAMVFQKINQIDSAVFYGRKALDYFQNNKMTVQAWGENSLYYVGEISPLLAELYKANNQPDSAYKYLQLSIAVKDSLYNTDIVRQFQTLGFNEANRRLQLEQQSKEEKQNYETKIKMYSLISVITGIGVLALLLYRNNRQKQKANDVLEKTLANLKQTQTQLIQSEKMASLGELTAGIAHEIQNPLNFVNNFSEVNTELIDELKAELAIGNMQLAIDLANDIRDNEQKINHHGKRADAIVKGMLQHSRSSSGVKEPTDINALCDEYLRLSYHGLRAKDKSFNATMKTDFDSSLEKINIIPQDIGRVILNLINNAFYAVGERSEAGSPDQNIGAASLPSPDKIGINEGGSLNSVNKKTPTVWVSTKEEGNKVLISVKDNGPGIPQNILDKIFQPFFTTKPTGQGTGLGLSLSYDIIKAHGGELSVKTTEGEGTNFTINLPS